MHLFFHKGQFVLYSSVFWSEVLVYHLLCFSLAIGVHFLCIIFLDQISRPAGQTHQKAYTIFLLQKNLVQPQLHSHITSPCSVGHQRRLDLRRDATISVPQWDPQQCHHQKNIIYQGFSGRQYQLDLRLKGTTSPPLNNLEQLHFQDGMIDLCSTERRYHPDRPQGDTTSSPRLDPQQHPYRHHTKNQFDAERRYHPEQQPSDTISSLQYNLG